MRKVLFLCAVGLAAGACGLSSASSPPPAQTLKVDPLDQTCAGDGDCTMTMTRCSCHCGEPINKSHWQKYLKARDEMCKAYSGPMCKMSCAGAPKCVAGTCQLVDAGL
jgi:hypothetical protein